MSREDYFYKRKAIMIAKELKYPSVVITALKSAKTEAEIERIMVSARRKYL